MNLKGRTAIVTGAGAGIGEASALRLSSAGMRVLGVDLDGERLAHLIRLAEARGFPLETALADVSQAADCRRVVEEALERWDSVDILFNNAGVVHQGNLLESKDEDWDRALNINARSMFYMCRACLPSMLARGSGNIINMASVVGVSGVPNRFVYSVSKAAVVGLTRSLAADFVDRGIRVNCICPGTVDTPSLRQRIASAPDPEKARSDFIRRQPMGRLGRAGEIAALVAYLASPESGYMTGQAIVIDGGMKL